MSQRKNPPTVCQEETRGKLHVGMRNVKTGLAVFLCLAIYSLIGREGVSLACTSAIICMQDSLEKSVASGRNRLIGTAFGALLGMGFLYLNEFVPAFDLTLITATLGTMLYILLCNVIKKQDSIVIGCVVLLMIVLGQTDQTPFVYSANRLIDTFVGIVLSILINRFIRNPRGDGEAPDSREEKPGDAPAAVENNGTVMPDRVQNGDPGKHQ